MEVTQFTLMSSTCERLARVIGGSAQVLYPLNKLEKYKSPPDNGPL
jgi:hypothetical protein